MAETTTADVLVQIPFLCTDQYGEAVICHGAIPDRNTDRNRRLISSMVRAFVELLLHAKNINDYDDHAIIVGQRFRFGIRDGKPYNTLSNSHR